MTGPRDVCGPVLEGCSLHVAVEGNIQEREIEEVLGGRLGS